MSVFAAVLLAVGPFCAAAVSAPRVAEERVVLHTVAGDIVLALYPDVAPRHVAQVLKLARLGVYDTSHFLAVVPGFFAQLSGHAERSSSLYPRQAAAIHPLKAEISSLHHERGTLSMARDERDLDSAETSFSIILGDWPYGDGRYTIFGKVESGMGVVEELLKVPRDSEDRPRARLSVLGAEVVGRTELGKRRLAPAQPVDVPAAAAATPAGELPELRVVAWGALMTAIISVLCFFCTSRYPRAAESLNLFNVLIAVFFLLVLIAPMLHSPLLGLLLFLSLLGALKMMSLFEGQVDRAGRKPQRK